jgi:hypothetical protein
VETFVDILQLAKAKILDTNKDEEKRTDQRTLKLSITYEAAYRMHSDPEG